jgi:hypothetical protein
MMKRLFAALLVLCIFCLPGCGIMREVYSGIDEAATLAENFCTALSEDDLETAKGYLHKDGTPKAEALGLTVARLEQTHKIDFSEGVSFKKRVEGSGAYYSSQYDGSVYEITYEVTVGGVETKLFFTVVKNDADYGIYGFGVVK